MNPRLSLDRSNSVMHMFTFLFRTQEKIHVILPSGNNTFCAIISRYVSIRDEINYDAEGSCNIGQAYRKLLRASVIVILSLALMIIMISRKTLWRRRAISNPTQARITHGNRTYLYAASIHFLVPKKNYPFNNRAFSSCVFQ